MIQDSWAVRPVGRKPLRTAETPTCCGRRLVVAEKTFDCVLCGSCVVDLLVWPVPLTTPIGGGRLIPADPIGVTTGGIVSNSGIAMTRLGMRVAAFSLVGDDEWASVIRRRYAEEHVDAQHCVILLE